MSPTANTPGTLVRRRSSASTQPRSIATPTSSKPIPLALGPRPTATSMISAECVEPSSRVATTPLSSWVTLAKRTPVVNAIFRLRNARSRAFEHASSSAGTSRGRASMMVTCDPKDFQTEANSTPITPPPSTITLAGM